MIRKDKKDTTAIYRNGIAHTAVYKGYQLVWQAVRSCFGRGYWINARPWLNNDSWKNNG